MRHAPSGYCAKPTGWVFWWRCGAQSILAVQECGMAFTGYLLSLLTLPSLLHPQKAPKGTFIVCIKSTSFIPVHNLPKNKHYHQLTMWEISQKKGERRHLGREIHRDEGGKAEWGMRKDRSVTAPGRQCSSDMEGASRWGRTGSSCSGVSFPLVQTKVSWTQGSEQGGFVF